MQYVSINSLNFSRTNLILLSVATSAFGGMHTLLLNGSFVAVRYVKPKLLLSKSNTSSLLVFSNIIEYKTEYFNKRTHPCYAKYFSTFSNGGKTTAYPILYASFTSFRIQQRGNRKLNSKKDEIMKSQELFHYTAANFGI